MKGSRCPITDPDGTPMASAYSDSFAVSLTGPKVVSASAVTSASDSLGPLPWIPTTPGHRQLCPCNQLNTRAVESYSAALHLWKEQ